MIVPLSYDGAVAVATVASGVKTADVGAAKGFFSGLFVTASGTLVFTDSLGNVVTIAVLGGYVVPIKCVNVINTSTASVVGLISVA